MATQNLEITDDQPFSLAGKTAMITGGASGIGASMAQLFTRAGAAVIVVDLAAEQAQEVVSKLPGASARACDITNEDQVRSLFSGLKELDILVNCAGIGLVGGVEETSLGDWQRLFRVNVEGCFLVTREAIPLLKTVRGSVLNISSVAGLVGVRRRFAYCATKGAVIAMTRQLAVDYPTELRCNCIAPGTVESPFVEGYLNKYHQGEQEKIRAELHARQPLGRMGRPDEIAKLALYVCSPAADFMNGSVITIDGGWTAA